MNTAAHTAQTQQINGVDVTVYGGTARPVLSYALPGHVTGWTKRSGARTTYAELTCTCHLAGEAVAYPGEKSWISYGEEGWAERLNVAALAHVENAIAHGYMIRPAGGDRSRWADRHRENRLGLVLSLTESGVTAEEVDAAVEQIDSGRYFNGPDGTRFELAADRSPYAMDPLPIV